MFSNELIALKTRLAEVEKLKKHLLDSIAALEKAQSHFKTTGFVNGSNSSVDIVDESESFLTQKSAIKQAISVMPADFTAKDILQYLCDFQPAMHADLKPEVLNNVLYKCAKDGEIHHARKGKRGSPSVFRRGPSPVQTSGSGALAASPGPAISTVPAQ